MNILALVLLYKGDGLRLIIYACYPWDMVSYVSLGESFEKIEEWKEIRDRSEEFKGYESLR
jgi:hypothetical protein